MLHKPFTSTFGASFIELSSVESTNNYALTETRLGKAGHGTAFFTKEQTAGKGQMGKKWASQKGMNIALSIVLNPKPLTLTQQFYISAATAIAALGFLQPFAGNELKVKWPNDLYWRDRKIGGILIESIVGSEKNEPEQVDKKNNAAWKWAIIGIGVNINQVQFSPDLPNPVSLRQITGQTFDVVELARQLHIAVIKGFEKLPVQGFDAIHSAYLENLYKLNETVRLKKGSRIFQTTIKTVSAEGKLITATNNLDEVFDFGEISWIIE